ncbi:hypothetical protein KO506_06700 [Polaribacter vadi]|uniref:hypothetical protein n=1 Tax=Polaribacter TaxID=52959 RepID=UPI001C0A3D1D|nr:MULTISPECIES: hypothetical protein [Polaribacter]MBU3011084.1 hypothetical protein [Polaribacter vadi]MDO6740898.1 hypothetical protein [Polaribacter sp. 1_MG-2023]
MKSKHKIKILLAAILLISSCNFKNEEKTDLKSNSDVVYIELDNGDTEIIRKNYEDGFVFENWNAYNMANAQLLSMENDEFKISKNRIIYLKKFVNNLSETIPSWLQTNEVQEEINDVEKEFTVLIDELNESTQQIRANCKELNKEFKDLRQDINERVEDYTNS